MSDNLSRRHILSAIGTGISLLPFLGLTGCNQEKEVLTEKKLFTDPKLELLDLALQHEYGAIVQYSNHAGIISSLAKENDSEVKEQIEHVIFDEVQHAILLSNILTNNGVTPTISVWPPQTAEKPLDMIKKDIMAEHGAIKLYEQISSLDLTDSERDIIETIGNAEVAHHAMFSQLVDELT